MVGQKVGKVKTRALTSETSALRASMPAKQKIGRILDNLNRQEQLK